MAPPPTAPWSSSSTTPGPAPRTPSPSPRKKKAGVLNPGPPSSGKKKKPTRSVSFALPALPFPLASFLHPLRSASNQWLVVPAILMVAFLFRWAVGLGPYSGMATPPMHGDFEAQRHWMEITTHLPMKEWYFHDLQWWGLDYPPLTAYHSWLCGRIGSLINPTWFALHTSRTLDNYHLKLFMRSTSLLSEYLIYIPPLLLLTRTLSLLPQRTISKYDLAIATTSILLQPALILIDHGHFQYNSIMLGFTLAALAMFIRDHLLWGSFFFVLSIGFKQMALYYAPAVFFYLLGLCVFPKINIPRLLAIGIATLSTFTILLLPLFISGGIPVLAQVLHRCFPFSRGLWEDKVANLWCTLSPIIKFRQLFSTQTLQRLSLLATLAAILPPCLIIFFNPQKHLLPLALAGCAWGFFLCSFQVHEKSVLLPLLPTTLILAQGLDSDTVSWVSWINNIANFSMWPLLRRDGLSLQYTVLSTFWAWLMGLGGKWSLPKSSFGKLVQLGTYAGVLGLHITELVLDNGIVRLLGPRVEKRVESVLERYPDLIVMGNVGVCFCAFAWMYGWIVVRLWREGLVEGAGKRKRE
ncbi:glycosyl transferase [Tirmania nivea]|nr:glycosyl transferase [Tirmania nivea]